MSRSSEFVYYQSGFSFQEILYDGHNGGVDGVCKFLEARIAQLDRRATQGELSQQDQERLELGLQAMREARELVPVILGVAR